MRKIIALASLLILAACSSGQPAGGTVDMVKAQNAVYAAKSTYAAALTVAVAYNGRGRCGRPASPVLCSDQAVVDQMRKADSVASSALDNAEKTVRSLTSSPSAVSAALLAAQNAVSGYKKLTDVYR